MHFYRSIGTIKAITFDLDDTLYDNSTIVDSAEIALIKVLQQYDELHDITLARFNHEKQVVLSIHPEIYHDVVAWRIETMRYMIKKVTSSEARINQIIDDGMANFNVWRHKINVPQATHALLTKLMLKYPLAIISNGNVEIEKIGLNNYFQFALRGGANGRSKPYPEIFDLASQKLNIPTNQILHVGDDLLADISGAINIGMQACWINIFGQDIYHLTNARCLPHVEITQLSELNNLL